MLLEAIDNGSWCVSIISLSIAPLVLGIVGGCLRGRFRELISRGLEKLLLRVGLVSMHPAVQPSSQRAIKRPRTKNNEKFTQGGEAL